MNLTNLILWSATIIAGFTGAYKIEDIQRAVWKAQAKIIYESRTETWGSPDFLSGHSQSPNEGLKPKNLKHLEKDFVGTLATSVGWSP